MRRSEFDDGTGTILPKELEELLLKLDPPLGLGNMADSKDVLRCGGGGLRAAGGVVRVYCEARFHAAVCGEIAGV